NARTTPPHLHFGIYASGRGAVDPFPFIHQNREKLPVVNINESRLGEWSRVARNNAVLRSTPDAKGTPLTKLPKNAAVQVLAGTSNWYKIQLPGGQAGFLYKDNLESLEKPVRTHTLESDLEIIGHPEIAAAPVAALKKKTKVAILGFYQNFQLIKLADGSLGWLIKS